MICPMSTPESSFLSTWLPSTFVTVHGCLRLPFPFTRLAITQNLQWFPPCHPLSSSVVLRYEPTNRTNPHEWIPSTPPAAGLPGVRAAVLARERAARRPYARRPAHRRADGIRAKCIGVGAGAPCDQQGAAEHEALIAGLPAKERFMLSGRPDEVGARTRRFV